MRNLNPDEIYDQVVAIERKKAEDARSKIMALQARLDSIQD